MGGGQSDGRGAGGEAGSAQVPQIPPGNLAGPTSGDGGGRPGSAHHLRPPVTLAPPGGSRKAVSPASAQILSQPWDPWGRGWWGVTHYPSLLPRPQPCTRPRLHSPATGLPWLPGGPEHASPAPHEEGADRRRRGLETEPPAPALRGRRADLTIWLNGHLIRVRAVPGCRGDPGPATASLAT